MQFIDLKTQQDRIRFQIDAKIKKVLEHGQYVMGPEVYELEERLADFVGVRHCISVSSGTDALLVAMMALEIGPGDEVITTPFTFIATGEMIVLLGAKPVFVDIDCKTFNIDPLKIDAAITSKTKAIMPVNLYGQCADYDAINLIAKKHCLLVIEDAAQSLGATYKGRQSCSLSIIGCTSFFPSKPLGGYGDSGACFTDDDEIAKVIRELRLHGQDHHNRIGINGRMDTLQAAIILSKFDIFSDEILRRSEIGARYSLMIDQACQGVVSPYIASCNTSVFAQYTVLVKNREGLINEFKEADIPVAVHYPLPLNKQPALKTTEFNLLIAEEISNKVMSLPMHPYLCEVEQNLVVDILAQKI